MADYTTLQNVKEYLAIEGEGDDAVLKRLITACTSAMDAITSRNLAAATYTEKLDGQASGWGKTNLYLKNHPINSVTSVSIDGAAVPAGTGTGPGWYLVDDMVQLVGYAATEGQGNVTVVYNGGYQTIPAELETVCIQLVAMRFRERSRLGVSSENSGTGMSRTYDFGMPAWCEKVLNQYADVVPR